MSQNFETRTELDKMIQDELSSHFPIELTQEKIAFFWAMLYDTIKNFNFKSKLYLSESACQWLQYIYFAEIIAIETKESGKIFLADIVSFEKHVLIGDINIVDLIKLKKLYSESFLEARINDELTRRLEKHNEKLKH